MIKVSVVLAIRNNNNERIVDKAAATTEIIRTSPPINSHKWIRWPKESKSIKGLNIKNHAIGED